MLQVLYDMFPYTCPAFPFASINTGDLFEQPIDGKNQLFRLIYRDAINVKVVHWNWFTRLFWGGIINGREPKFRSS